MTFDEALIAIRNEFGNPVGTSAEAGLFCWDPRAIASFPGVRHQYVRTRMSVARTGRRDGGRRGRPGLSSTWRTSCR